MHHQICSIDLHYFDIQKRNKNTIVNGNERVSRRPVSKRNKNKIVNGNERVSVRLVSDLYSGKIIKKIHH